MEAFIEYLIKASVYLLVFSLGYFLLSGAGGHARFKRLYILLAFLLSLGLASIGKIPVNLGAAGAQGEGGVVFLPEVIIGAQTGIVEAGSRVSHGMSMARNWHFVAGLIALFMIVQLVRRIWSIYKEVKNHPVEKLGEVDLVLVSNNRSPFSFFRWVFIPACLRNSEHIDKVIAHEKAHYYYRHSWDVIFMEVMRLVFWFHPAWYILRYELQTLHEYEADNFALTKFPKTDYQRALLDFALGAHYLPVTNPFNVSMIKKRFIMMNKNQRTGLKKLLIRLMFVLPFVAAVFFVQSCDFRDDIAESKDLISDSEVKTTEYDGDPIFNEVEVNPEFPGGVSQLMHFLQTNLRYPTPARENGIQGTVFVSFVVEKDGAITNIKILRGVNPDLDAEAMRVVRMMPNWDPAYQDGENVRVQFNLPIRFVLN